MTYSIDVYPDKDYFLLKITSKFRVGEHIDEVLRDVLKVLDSAPVAMFYVSDVREMGVIFQDVLTGMAKLVSGGMGGKSVLKHPKIKEFVLVTSQDSAMMRIGSQALAQQKVSSHRVSMVSSLEEAEAYINSKQ